MVGPEQRHDLVVRQRLGHAALAADDAFGAPEHGRTVVGESTQ
jgi:hypothetical protein